MSSFVEKKAAEIRSLQTTLSAEYGKPMRKRLPLWEADLELSLKVAKREYERLSGESADV